MGGWGGGVLFLAFVFFFFVFWGGGLLCQLTFFCKFWWHDRVSSWKAAIRIRVSIDPQYTGLVIRGDDRGRSSGWERVNSGPVWQEVGHDKDPSLLKRFCSPSPAMVTSLYQWNIINRNVEQSTIHQPILKSNGHAWRIVELENLPELSPEQKTSSVFIFGRTIKGYSKCSFSFLSPKNMIWF